VYKMSAGIIMPGAAHWQAHWQASSLRSGGPLTTLRLPVALAVPHCRSTAVGAWLLSTLRVWLSQPIYKAQNSSLPTLHTSPPQTTQLQCSTLGAPARPPSCARCTHTLTHTHTHTHTHTCPPQL
jgi:uncharacterized paraquat-inducible protein A